MQKGHNHEANSFNRAFAVGVTLNLLFVVVEIAYGMLAKSLALIADAGHNLSDVLSLLLAWGAGAFAARATTEKRTYGFRKVTIMASLASAVLLLVSLGVIALEAFRRIENPRPVEGFVVIVVAAIGVVVNSITALLFVKGRKHDLNIRGAFLHMAADAGVSLGVFFTGIVIVLKGWLWIDPAVSLAIVAVILAGAWGLLQDSINHAIDAVPGHIDMSEIKNYLVGLDKVSSFHDLHVWPMSTTEVALTVHLVVTDNSLNNGLLLEIQQHLHENFGIEHATIQVEHQQAGKSCMLDRHTV